MVTSQTFAKGLEPPYRVVVAHSETMVRAALVHAMGGAPDLSVVAEATTEIGTLRAVRDMRPEVVVLGVAAPRMIGLRLLPLVRRTVPDSTVMALSVVASRRLVRHVLSEGADLCECVERHPRALVAVLREHLSSCMADVQRNAVLTASS